MNLPPKHVQIGTHSSPFLLELATTALVLRLPTVVQWLRISLESSSQALWLQASRPSASACCGQPLAAVGSAHLLLLHPEHSRQAGSFPPLGSQL